MTTWKIDFGEGAPAPSYIAVDAIIPFNPESGFGWIANSGVAVRDRNAEDRVLGKLVCGKGLATFRLVIDPGRYILRLVMGDKDFRDHRLQLGLSEHDDVFPILTAEANEYAALQVIIDVSQSFLDLTFSSPIENWVVNSLTLSPAEGKGLAASVVTHHSFDDGYDDTWNAGRTNVDRHASAGSIPTGADICVDLAAAALKVDTDVTQTSAPKKILSASEMSFSNASKSIASSVSADRGTFDQRVAHGAVTKAIRAVGTWLGI